ncbi:hypothetical protein KGF56_001594 [Candida oxycetoniae]|uniref:Uncharacterized protein n=1 Tax=Candida oxycetoniae TaxID=497107 RepID=A0AAI9WYP5_9ASCO|nr:uncharacterized protein KGF56_001594 [Candida oxycetoniae]KAI3405576.1 hypothetical protein KGF56_001594 [Candida oxycetoniae]
MLNNYQLVSIILASVLVVYLFNYKQQKPKAIKQKLDSRTGLVTPIKDFEWNRAEPLKSLPFKKGPYKLTMGIKRLDLQDWLLIEPGYLQRLTDKKNIINNSHPDYPQGKDLRGSTFFVTQEAHSAICELYDIVMDYMSTKYPTCFEIDDKRLNVKNLITQKTYPLHSKALNDPVVLQEYLAETIEEDFIILLKDPKRENEENGKEYFFKAGVFAFAAGFNPKERFNKPLTYIHHPVPQYETKLKTSMNRYFSRMVPGQFITRSNWSIQTHNKLYTDDSNKGHNLPKGYTQHAIDYNSVDFSQVHYRSERQVLTKLPKTQAIVFTIRTYLLPLAEIKKESREVRERLIGAIEGFTPDISAYKRADEWGSAVCQYLRE